MLNWKEDPSTLKKTRKRLGLTQTQLAKKAGVKLSLICNIEAGRRRLSEDIRDPIWKALAKVEKERGKGVVSTSPAKTVPLNSLLGGSVTLEDFKKLRTEASLEIAQERIRELEQLVETYRAIDAKAAKAIEGKGEIIREYQAVHEDDQRMIEGYRKLQETDRQIIALLQESGPGSAAMQGVQMLEELEKLRAENAELRTWLNAEEVAAVSHAKAVELRERVNVLGKAEQIPELERGE